MNFPTPKYKLFDKIEIKLTALVTGVSYNPNNSNKPFNYDLDIHIPHWVSSDNEQDRLYYLSVSKEEIDDIKIGRVCVDDKAFDKVHNEE